MDKKRTYKLLIFVLVGLFLLTSLATLGSFRATKGYAVLGKGEEITYQLQFGKGQTAVSAVYVNVGNVYCKVGDTLSVTVQRRTSSSETWFKGSLGSVKVANVSAEEMPTDKNGNDATSFGWVCFGNGVNLSSSYNYYKITTNGVVEINEVVFIGNDGRLVEASFSEKNSVGVSESEGNKTLDAQQSLVYTNDDGKMNEKRSFYRTFTAAEKYTLMQVRHILNGNSIFVGAEYAIDTNFNSFAALCYTPFVWMFGTSVFGLRLLSCLATVALLALVCHFIVFATKKVGAALIAGIAFVVLNAVLTVGRVGAPYSLLALLTLVSFCGLYRFYRKGIVDGKIRQSALPVFYAFASVGLATAMHSAAAFVYPVLAWVFALGLKKQKKAHEYRLTKAADEESARRENARYQYKKSIAWAYAVCGGILIPILVMAIAGYVTRSSYLMFYDADVTAVDGELKFSVGYFGILIRGFLHCLGL